MEENKKYCKIAEVKSNFITIKIITLLSLKKQLSLLTYNKILQQKLSFNLENYKQISQRCKIMENNESGKEYKIYTDIVIFEGEYKNGKRHGKGKEYHENNGKIKFEGEFFEGKKISGKEYDINGNVILTLENGKGEEYFNNGKLKFKGEYNNGKRWNGKGYNYKGEEQFEINEGKGTVYEYDFFGVLEFRGEYRDGERH